MEELLASVAPSIRRFALHTAPVAPAVAARVKAAASAWLASRPAPNLAR